MVIHNTTEVASNIDIFIGISSTPKKISSWYFYDKHGSRLFKAITQLKEYYLTKTETEIFECHAHSMVKSLTQNYGRFINIVELGAGDGIKTKILLRQLQSENKDFLFSPIDISGEALSMLEKNIQTEFPELNINKMEGDYFQQLEAIERLNHGPKVILFLGSSIGNYLNDEAVEFLSKLKSVMGPDDRLMIGFDMVKDAEVILNAYNDSSGITRDFNLNLLTRMNKEFGADFNVDNFQHCAVYDPVKQAALSYLVSTKRQEVFFSATNEIVSFNAWETIHTETSLKYTKNTITDMATKAGFKVKECYTDKKAYFSNVIFELDNKAGGLR